MTFVNLNWLKNHWESVCHRFWRMLFNYWLVLNRRKSLKWTNLLLLMSTEQSMLTFATSPSCLWQKEFQNSKTQISDTISRTSTSSPVYTFSKFQQPLAMIVGISKKAIKPLSTPLSTKCSPKSDLKLFLLSSFSQFQMMYSQQRLVTSTVTSMSPT